MRSIYDKWKSLIIALMILCTGLCLQPEKAVFDRSCASSSAPKATIIVADNTFDEAQLCTVETIGTYYSIGIRALENDLNRFMRETSSSLAFLSSDIFSMREENTSADSDVVKCVFGHSQEMIANYIHNTDGKK